ncbi:MAG TPA: formate/nitrite transporter family protein [Clostridiales bacterium]|nr:formate/nitrite transporter family protein [Clostridiales bacterium]
MKKLATFIYAVLAGISISIGCIAYLSIENKVVGAIFFTIGLFTVVTHGLNLFTGKVCYVFEKDRAYALNLPIIWLGNLIGAVGIGLLVQLTRIAGISQRAAQLCEIKLADGPLSIFILAVFCNILIFLAVDGFVRNEKHIGKYIALFLGVSVFVICGFEHCVANMFYFSAGGVWSLKTLLYIIIMTLGNAVGGVIFPLVRRLRARAEADAEQVGSVK